MKGVYCFFFRSSRYWKEIHAPFAKMEIVNYILKILKIRCYQPEGYKNRSTRRTVGRILGFIIFSSNLETWQFYKIKREKEEKQRRRGIEKEAERKRVRAREGERRRRERKGFVQAYHGEGAEEYTVEKYWLCFEPDYLQRMRK